MPGITDNDQALLEKVIATLPYLNGLDPNKRMPVDFGTEKPANNRFYGPKVMKKARHLVLLYLARNVEIFKTRGKVFGHLHYFTRTTLEKVAGYDAFKPDYIKFVRQRADKDFEDYRKQGLVELKKHQGQKYWSLTPKGVKAATRIINNLLQCLPTDKVPLQTVATESLGVLSEYPLLSFFEYVTRKDVEHILKYKKFTGRDDELRSLNNLISSGKKIFALVGPSGIGKTRLMLEFSREEQ
jgi:hypothetical protein